VKLEKAFAAERSAWREAVRLVMIRWTLLSVFLNGQKILALPPIERCTCELELTGADLKLIQKLETDIDASV
jgi:hypothetical protein